MELNFTEKVFKKDIRKDLYQVEKDYYETFISLVTLIRLDSSANFVF